MSLSLRVRKESKASNVASLCRRGSRMVVTPDKDTPLSHAEGCKSSNLRQFLTNNCFYRASLSKRLSVAIKLEGLNPAGSIKLKVALALVGALEAEGFSPPSRIIESSSGNLGIALAMVCANKGYHFTCVVDPNTSRNSLQMMKALGAQVFEVSEKDENGGYLLSRINYIKQVLDTDPRYMWTNQYANSNNPQIHMETTAAEIYDKFPDLKFLFIGSGTTGTLTGCSKYFRNRSAETKIIAVEPTGSITFGGRPSRRRIPGLGTSRVPEIACQDVFDDLVYIDDPTTIMMCRRMAMRTGFLFGGSTGTVLAAVEEFFGSKPESSIVAISPDFGEHYINTIYNDAWVEREFPNLLVSEPKGDAEQREFGRCSWT